MNMLVKYFVVTILLLALAVGVFLWLKDFLNPPKTFNEEAFFKKNRIPTSINVDIMKDGRVLELEPSPENIQPLEIGITGRENPFQPYR